MSDFICFVETNNVQAAVYNDGYVDLRVDDIPFPSSVDMIVSGESYLEKEFREFAHELCKELQAKYSGRNWLYNQEVRDSIGAPRWAAKFVSDWE